MSELEQAIEGFVELFEGLSDSERDGLHPQAIHKAAHYLALLKKWNKAYNLTAIQDDTLLVRRHWCDSLTIAPYVKGARVLDVGTGAGLPGIPLATKFTDKQFCLLDSNTKRHIFLQQVVHQLGLSNVLLHCGRVELYHSEHQFDCIVSRAFKSLSEFITLTKSQLAPGGSFLAMKATIDDAELAKIDNDFEVTDVIPLTNVEPDKERHLVIVKSKQAT